MRLSFLVYLAAKNLMSLSFPVSLLLSCWLELWAPRSMIKLGLLIVALVVDVKEVM